MSAMFKKIKLKKKKFMMDENEIYLVTEGTEEWFFTCVSALMGHQNATIKKLLLKIINNYCSVLEK